MTDIPTRTVLATDLSVGDVIVVKNTNGSRKGNGELWGTLFYKIVKVDLDKYTDVVHLITHRRDHPFPKYDCIMNIGRICEVEIEIKEQTHEGSD